jgi:hypothetical protein
MWETVPLPPDELDEEFECQGFCFFIRKQGGTYLAYEKTTTFVIGLAFYKKSTLFENTEIFIKAKVKSGEMEKTIRYRIKERGYINGGPEDLPFDIEKAEKPIVMPKTVYNKGEKAVVITQPKMASIPGIKEIKTGGGLF